MTFKRIQEPVIQDFQAMKALIQRAFQSEAPLIETVGQHILCNTGKCLRPLIVLLSSKACGYKGDRHRVAAALIELIHTATLLHDDVVDDAQKRRGQPTAKALWGNEAAILVGDFLYAKAFELVLELDHPQMMTLLIKTTQQMAEGEALQLLGRRQLQTQASDYRRIIQAKTAKLFETCAKMGALLSDASPILEQALGDYGMHLGTAFQLLDDVLDFEADPGQQDKDPGNDLMEGKMTLPLIYALAHSNATQRAVLEQAIAGYEPAAFAGVLAVLRETGGLDYTTNLAATELEKAKTALDPLPDSIYKEALIQLCAFLRNPGH